MKLLKSRLTAEFLKIRFMDNRMGKTRDLFKEIADTKGKFHANMSTIKGRHLKDLTQQKIKKRCQEYTEELHKKVLMTQITTMVWSHT